MKTSLRKALQTCIALAAPAIGLSAEVGVATHISDDFGKPLSSGFFQGQGPVVGNVPDTSHTWTHMISSRHSNPSNNYALQLASTFAGNERLFFRKIAAPGTSNPNWVELATRGLNTFAGDQTIEGGLVFSGLQTISGTARLNIAGPERLYVLNSDGLYVSQSSGGNGNLNVEGSGYFEGNVGIGTATPDNKLDVNGTIRAKEVIVETGWADYVFEEGYSLWSLSEVAAHISAHGHLPGVPSAPEVASSGVPLGDSQRILLEKIEELTLYAIDKDKRVNSLELENGRLRLTLGSVLSRLEALERQN